MGSRARETSASLLIALTLRSNDPATGWKFRDREDCYV
jgi:hypothetical protein